MLRAISAVLLACAVAFPSSAQQTLQRFHETHAAMGTEFSLDVYAPDAATAEHAATVAFDEIDRLDDLLSNYKRTSELSRINREAVSGPVVTDPETFAFLERSQQWSRRSDGAFDITVGPLLRLWGFFFRHGRIPSPQELAEVEKRVGWKHLQLDPRTRSVSFQNHLPLELDPGSIGKGFAVDKVVAVLRGIGITSAFLSAGNSTLYGIGSPPGASGWPVNVPDPTHPGRVASVILLRDMSLSTGACSMKFFIQNGHRYCHIFDPRTGRPVEGVLQTSVLAPSATDSDALSTVAFVLSGKAAQALLERLPETRTLIFRTPDEPSPCVAIHWEGQPCQAAASGK